MPPWRVSLSSVETVDFCKSLPWTILIFLELWGVDLRTGYRYFQAMANKMSVLTTEVNTLTVGV